MPDSDSAALVGIPIGTTFLAGVAAVYSSEEKPRIYRFASAYLKDLVTMSDKRLRQCTILASTRSQPILADAEQALKVATTRLGEAREREKHVQSEVESARNKLDALSSETKKAAQRTMIAALDHELGKASDTTVKAETALLGATNDFNDVTRCSDPRIAVRPPQRSRWWLPRRRTILAISYRRSRAVAGIFRVSSRLRRWP